MTARTIYACEECGGEEPESWPLCPDPPGGWVVVVYPKRQTLHFCCEVCLSRWAARHAAVAIRRPLGVEHDG